ncbi:transcriptional regulator [Pseudomonas donghuensis]|uniref:Helix-turn-helix domain-containing protein n=1 Tax=Pseudomonas donghuensis TaxID=1163398 RepID=A0AAQ0DLZ6_9PSED|nr:YdaS family helix-turn-helix protein [Pseudomonas donghuensis]QWE81232.1 helix-turn-helix domain-containing protein [Pseudomonas donghuensis]
MNLLDYIKGLSSAQVEALAEACKTSAGQLKQVAYGNRRASAGLAIAIDRVTAGLVTCEELRPDIDWPYLRRSAPPDLTLGGVQAA